VRVSSESISTEKSLFESVCSFVFWLSYWVFVWMLIFFIIIIDFWSVNESVILIFCIDRFGFKCESSFMRFRCSLVCMSDSMKIKFYFFAARIWNWVFLWFVHLGINHRKSDIVKKRSCINILLYMIH
jgi:hypothetical protein